jgi:hypothetical protein
MIVCVQFLSFIQVNQFIPFHSIPIHSFSIIQEVSLSYTSVCPVRMGLLFSHSAMTKTQILMIFARSGRFLKPDEVLAQLKPRPDRRSLYSYLARLQRQGLLDRHPNSRRGNLAYILTDRGQARLEYFRVHPGTDARL